MDGSRAFTTGKFVEDLNDNLDDLSESQIADIFQWQEFFEKTYTFVGLISGRFYNSNGEASISLKHARSLYENSKKVGIGKKIVHGYFHY